MNCKDKIMKGCIPLWPLWSLVSGANGREERNFLTQAPSPIRQAQGYGGPGSRIRLRKIGTTADRENTEKKMICRDKRAKEVYFSVNPVGSSERRERA